MFESMIFPFLPFGGSHLIVPGGYIPGEILHEARDPALLEQSAGNIFTARVFPIEPYAPLDEYKRFQRNYRKIRVKTC